MKNAVAILLALAGYLSAQNSAKQDASAQVQKATLQQAATAGLPMQASINVADNVGIEAVMLPYDVANRVFGKDVANNYAVIEVNISNRSNDAALIVHSLLIDLHDWGFAGPMSSGPSVGGVSRSSQSQPFQATASPLEVSSVEYRIVRGEMLDRQPNTLRNFSLRTMQALGSIGVAFAFPFTKDVATGIAAWNGAVIPAFQALFPDGLQAQMDRVSDYGFRNNKVIPQQAADIIVAFFPIRRFLTPTLENIFKRSPALFFNPILMAIDPGSRGDVNQMLKDALNGGATDAQFKSMMDQFTTVSSTQAQYAFDLEKVEEANAAVSADQTANAQDSAAKANQSAADQHKALLASWQMTRDTDKVALDKATHDLAGNKLYGVLGSLSLNNVHLAVRGIMTVDVDSVPSIVTSLDCNKAGDTSMLIWAQSGDLTCAIHGSFLSNGTPAIAEASALGLTVGTIAQGSNDSLLNLKLTLSKPLDPKTVLTFTVTKKNKQGNTVESMKFPYTVPDYVLAAPVVNKVSVDGSTVTVAGDNFFDTPKSALAVTAHAEAPKDGKDQTGIKPSALTPKQIQFDAKAFPSACYQVQVKSGSQQNTPSTTKPPQDQFAWYLNPKIDSAPAPAASATTMTITVENLPDLTGCDSSTLIFELTSDAAEAMPVKVAKLQFSSDDKSVTLTLPALTNGAKKWTKVEALMNGKPMQPNVAADIK